MVKKCPFMVGVEMRFRVLTGIVLSFSEWKKMIFFDLTVFEILL